MDEVFAFRLIGAIACLLAAFMIFVFGTILFRRLRERRSADDPGRSSGSHDE